MLPISCELSPSRFSRFAVSWMVSRISPMPAMVSRTAVAPRCANSTDLRATSLDSEALADTCSIDAAMSWMDAVDFMISAFCLSLATLSWMARVRLACDESATRSAVWLMRATIWRSASMA